MSFKSTLIAVVACCVTTMATSRLNGDTIYYDNFSDGSATDGSPVTWTKFSQWPLTTVTVIDGDMHLSASRANELGLVGVREEFTDTSLRTQVRLIDATGEQGVGVIVRGDPDRGSYFFDLGIEGTALLGIFGERHYLETDLRPGEEDVIMQLDAIGDEVKAWAWPASEDMPAEPLFSLTSQALQFGKTGLFYEWGINDRPSPEPPGTAIIRYVHVADSHISVPEPTALTLGLVASVAGLLSLRRGDRRRGN